jgi:hypothetical protein
MKQIQNKLIYYNINRLWFSTYVEQNRKHWKDTGIKTLLWIRYAKMVYFELFIYFLLLFIYLFNSKSKELETPVNLITGFSESQILFLVVAFIFNGNAQISVVI